MPCHRSPTSYGDIGKGDVTPFLYMTKSVCPRESGKGLVVIDPLLATTAVFCIRTL
jgi:hypothetical protein